MGTLFLILKQSDAVWSGHLDKIFIQGISLLIKPLQNLLHSCIAIFSRIILRWYC